MGVAHTLSRRFFWCENILWKHDIQGKPVTVSLGGKDLIVDTHTVRDYLTGEEGEIGMRSVRSEKQSDWKGAEGKKPALDVLWFANLDHAQVFDSRKNRRRLVEVVMGYCARR